MEHETTRPYRTYDTRIKAMIVLSGDPHLIPELQIPRSTALTWMRRGADDLVTHDVLDFDTLRLQAAILDLQKRFSDLAAENRLLASILKLAGLFDDGVRLPESGEKQVVLDAINEAARTLPLQRCLDVIGLTGARLRQWRQRADVCQLADHSSCPKSMPAKVTPQEIATVRDIVLNQAYAHIPVHALAALARRLGVVCASASTWYALMRKFGWKQPKERVYPDRPREGIRAKHANEIWHADVSLIWLADGTRAYLRAVIDNYSRYVLAWSVTLTNTGLECMELLEQALRRAAELGTIDVPILLCDSGTENLNGYVDRLVAALRIIRVQAQIDIRFSNSMIERLFLSAKHNHLFQCVLSSLDVLRRQFGFYIGHHNVVIPHAAFNGATPVEMFLGQWSIELDRTFRQTLVQARERRMSYHRSLPSCPVCPSRAVASEVQ